jgi:membrane protein
MKVKPVVSLFKDTFSQWSENHASRMAAALAFYSVSSMAPLLLIVIVVVGQVVGQGTARQQILSQISSSLGPASANLIGGMLTSISRTGSSILATVAGVAGTLLSAIGLFVELQNELNLIWQVKPEGKKGILDQVKRRLLGFAMILGCGFLFLLLLLLSTALSAIQKYLTNYVPNLPVLWHGLSFVIPFIVMTLLFALIFKFLPDARTPWRDVWWGALFTALLMSIGNLLIGLYLGRAGAASAYGVAGSLVLILIWVYYSAQIFFFGAVFTRVLSRRSESRVQAGSSSQETSE